MKKKISLFLVVLIAVTCLSGCLKTKIFIFEDYQGPILPLSTVSDASGIVAKRHITCDYSQYHYSDVYFQKYETEKENRIVTISDQYTLKNTTNEDKVLELAYGFTGAYSSSNEIVPVMEINGEVIPSELIVGGNPVFYGFEYNSRGFNMHTREEFEELLTDGDYQKDAFELKKSPPTLSEPVTVYKFEDVKYDLDDKEAVPYAELVVSYDSDKTELFTHKVVRHTEEDGTTALGFTVEKRGMFGHGKDVYIIAAGEEPKVEDVKCYRHEMSDKETDEFSVEYVKYESTLEEVLQEITTYYKGEYHSAGSLYSRLTDEQILSVGKQDMMSLRQQGQPVIALEDILFQRFSAMRVFYKNTQVTVPANDTIEIIWKYDKYVGIKDIDNGNYDGVEIMANLGSNIKTERQVLEVVGMDDLIVSEYTTGEALENGECEVEIADDYFEIYLEVPEKEYNPKGWRNRGQ